MMTSDLQLTDIHVFVVHSQLSGHETCLHVLGGYAAGDTLMVLYRDAAAGFAPARDLIGKYVAKYGELEMESRNDYEYLLDENWTTFGLMAEGEHFRMGGFVWTKLPLDRLREILHNKILVAS